MLSLLHLCPKLWSRINTTALIPGSVPFTTRYCHTVQVLDLSVPLDFKAEAVVDKDWVKTVQVTSYFFGRRGASFDPPITTYDIRV